MLVCLDRAAVFCSILHTTVALCRPHGVARGWRGPDCGLGFPRCDSFGVSDGMQLIGTKFYVDLKFRTHGKGSRRIKSMAVTPSQFEAAGVTESGSFSQSDEDLASRGLSVHSTMADLDLDQLNSLFAKVSFPRREKQKLLKALQNTQSLQWIQEAKTSNLIGFARATGDRVFHAIIWDVVVDPSYQGLGLGKVLMERLMADLVRMGISNIALYAEPTVVGFYQPLGFVTDPDGIRAMAYSQRPR